MTIISGVTPTTEASKAIIDNFNKFKCGKLKLEEMEKYNADIVINYSVDGLNDYKYSQLPATPFILMQINELKGKLEQRGGNYKEQKEVRKMLAELEKSGKEELEHYWSERRRIEAINIINRDKLEAMLLMFGREDEAENRQKINALLERYPV